MVYHFMQNIKRTLKLCDIKKNLLNCGNCIGKMNLPKYVQRQFWVIVFHQLCCRMMRESTTAAETVNGKHQVCFQQSGPVCFAIYSNLKKMIAIGTIQATLLAMMLTQYTTGPTRRVEEAAQEKLAYLRTMGLVYLNPTMYARLKRTGCQKENLELTEWKKQIDKFIDYIALQSLTEVKIRITNHYKNLNFTIITEVMMMHENEMLINSDFQMLSILWML